MAVFDCLAGSEFSIARMSFEGAGSERGSNVFRIMAGTSSIPHVCDTKPSYCAD